MSISLIKVSDFNAEGPPVPIPNTEVKLCCGDNTCLETSRKDSSLLTHKTAKSGLVGVFNAEGPPVPIPNTEVKLCCGDNTCLETDRKDSSMPTQKEKNRNVVSVLFFLNQRAVFTDFRWCFSIVLFENLSEIRGIAKIQRGADLLKMLWKLKIAAR